MNGLIVVLICTPLMTRDIEQLFVCRLAGRMSSGEECPFSSFAQFLIRLFVFCGCTALVLITWIVHYFKRLLDIYLRFCGTAYSICTYVNAGIVHGDLPVCKTPPHTEKICPCCLLWGKFNGGYRQHKPFTAFDYWMLLPSNFVLRY